MKCAQETQALFALLIPMERNLNYLAVSDSMFGKQE